MPNASKSTKMEQLRKKFRDPTNPDAHNITQSNAERVIITAGGRCDNHIIHFSGKMTTNVADAINFLVREYMYTWEKLDRNQQNRELGRPQEP